MGTIRIRGSYRRADDDLEHLLYKLQEFVNLTTETAAFQKFFEDYPEFQPVPFYDSESVGVHDEEPKPKLRGWRPEFHALFREFRDILRDVWSRGDNSKLAVLLGTDAQAWEILHRRNPPSTLDKILEGHQTLLERAMTEIPTRYFTVGAAVYPDWKAGEFRYDADSDFRRAVYVLFRNSWRAKLCPHCDKYFIADKTAQRYCSSKCYAAIKRDYDLVYWRLTGRNRREARLRKNRGRAKKT
jgi:hypothetical protein